jgi:hypothetical protein
MQKLKLGDEFSDESEQTTPSEEELAEVEESEDEAQEEQESEEDESSEDDDKLRELQGLQNTEQELDSEVGDLDLQIQTARQRIVEKRQARREKRDIIQTVVPIVPEVNDEVDLSDVDSEQIELFERIAKARGYVPASVLKQEKFEETRKSAQDLFLEKHKEYLPENDTDDTLYNALKAELALYVAPSDPALIPKLFERAHTHVVKAYPDKFNTKTKITPQQVAASARTKVASSGLQQTKTSVAKNPQAQSVMTEHRINILRNSGWTEEDIAELLE